MKKRFLSLLLFLLPALAALAGVRIPSSDALGLASAFFDGAAAAGKTKAASSSGSLRLVKTAPDDAFYIFNRDGGGFVIVSGDDSVGPYLAYSYDNSFSVKDMPENVSRYLKSLEEEVRYCRLHPGTKAGVSSTFTLLSSEEKVLETALWDQSQPYNNLLPSYEGEKCVTGCVATGMAIVLRYKKWPEKGTGHLDSYTTSTLKIEVEGYDLGHSYDWDNMPLVPAYGIDSYQENQIATLMRDCGVMLQMDFTPEASGSGSEKVFPQLKEHMGYDAANSLEHRFDYSGEEWFAKIKESIDNDCPVLYAGETADGGHEFVVDGYNGDGYVHVNFGWSGHANGMYLLTDMRGFYRGQAALFNLQKDKGGVSPAEKPLIVLEGDGLSIDGTYSEASAFNVSATNLSNRGVSEFNGYFAIGLNDKDGKLQKIISNTISSIGTKYIPGSTFADMTFSCDPIRIKPGRGVQLYLKGEDETSWTRVPWDDTKGTRGILYLNGETADPLDDMSFEYDKTTGIIKILFPKNVESDCSFSAKGCWYFGDDFESGGKYKSISINTADLMSGEYTVTFTINGQKHTITVPIDNSYRDY